jgi:hypothetical protein
MTRLAILGALIISLTGLGLALGALYQGNHPAAAIDATLALIAWTAGRELT